MTMHYPLLVSGILNRARTSFPNKEIITRLEGTEGGVHRYTYRDMATRVNKLCNALTALGVKQGAGLFEAADKRHAAIEGGHLALVQGRRRAHGMRSRRRSNREGATSCA